MTPDDQLENWNERAAIREYDGGYTREEAERLATEDMEGRNEQSNRG